MNKLDFLFALEEQLQALPDQERKQALEYYFEIIDDRMDCGMNEEEIVECISATAKTISLSEQVGEESTLQDFIGKDFTPEINEKIALKQAIEKLPRDEREIIVLRYFKNLTQTETGRALGLTQVTVSRKEAKALMRLKTELV